LKANAFDIESNNGSLSQVFSTEPEYVKQSTHFSQSLQVVHIKQVHPGVQALIVSQFEGTGTGVGVGVGVGLGLGQS
jgi:hypothetical protein